MRKDLFRPVPPLLPHHVIEVTQQIQTRSIFWTDYIGKGVEESQLRDKGRWCLEVSHKDFDGFLFVKQRMILIDEEGDEEVIFETISQFEEGADPRIINTDQDTERAYQLEGNIKNLPLVITGGRKINS